MTTKLRILAVDDNPQMRKAMGRLLRAHDVVLCEDGTDAFALLKEDSAFDVILSDMDMAVMSGADLYRALVEHDVALSNKVVFVTGGGANRDQQEFLRGTVRPIVGKPFRPEELSCAIAAVVESR